VTIGAGVRVEDHVRYGTYGVPRVSAAVSLSEVGIRLRGGYGRAFTAPTLTDLYYPQYGADTLSLRPERSRTWEAGADGRWLDGRVEAHVTWHRTRFRDLIQSNSFFTADNIGRAAIEGKEASVRLWPTRAVALGWRVAHLPVAKNALTGERLGKRPRWRTGAELDVRASASVRLLASWRWSDSFHDPFDFVDVNGRDQRATPTHATLRSGNLAGVETSRHGLRAHAAAFDRHHAGAPAGNHQSFHDLQHMEGQLAARPVRPPRGDRHAMSASPRIR
jgi:outer membrane receptor protein involved in Fe transport